MKDKPRLSPGARVCFEKLGFLEVVRFSAEPDRVRDPFGWVAPVEAGLVFLPLSALYSAVARRLGLARPPAPVAQLTALTLLPPSEVAAFCEEGDGHPRLVALVARVAALGPGPAHRDGRRPRARTQGRRSHAQGPRGEQGEEREPDGLS